MAPKRKAPANKQKQNTKGVKKPTQLMAEHENIEGQAKPPEVVIPSNEEEINAQPLIAEQELVREAHVAEEEQAKKEAGIDVFGDSEDDEEKESKPEAKTKGAAKGGRGNAKKAKSPEAGVAPKSTRPVRGKKPATYAEDDEEPEVPKKAGGRGKKSSPAEEYEAESPGEEEPEKPKSGRKATNKAAAKPAPKPKRGGPKKAETPESEEEEDEEEAPPKKADTKKTTAKDAPKKSTKRGAPKKAESPESEPSGEEDEKEVPTKKSRGKKPVATKNDAPKKAPNKRTKQR